MFSFFKRRNQSNLIDDDIIVPISWSMLSKEQKIMIADIVLKDEKVSIMGVCGDIENARLLQCTGTGIIGGKTTFNFLTSNLFYTTVYFTEKQIIDRWLHYNKYGNKDYSNIA